MHPCVWRGNGALLGAKPPLVVANVACSASDTDCLCCHSFTLSLSGSANGDINQSVDTHAEAVMCYHSEGAETDKNGGHIPIQGKHPEQEDIQQNAGLNNGWTALGGKKKQIRLTQTWNSEWCCKKKKKMHSNYGGNRSCLLTLCMFRSTSYRSGPWCGKAAPEPVTGWKTGSRYFCRSPTVLMEQRQVAFQKIYK